LSKKEGFISLNHSLIMIPPPTTTPLSSSLVVILHNNDNTVSKIPRKFLLIVAAVLIIACPTTVDSFAIHGSCLQNTRSKPKPKQHVLAATPVSPTSSSSSNNNNGKQWQSNTNQRGTGPGNGASGSGSGSGHARSPDRVHGNKRNKIKVMFQTAKGMEKAGKWNEAIDIFKKILVDDPLDSHTHLAMARLEARRENGRPTTNDSDQQQHSTARNAFQEGTRCCPRSVHIWQAWARYEETSGDLTRAKELFEKALRLDATNPYVCHAYGLMEKKIGNTKKAKTLWETALKKKPTAALVCSLGEILIAEEELDEARELYRQYQCRLKSERETTEVFLAAAWLEEQYFRDYDRAEELIRMSLQKTPQSGRANVALARLEGRQNRRNDLSGKDATRKRLSKICTEIEKGYVKGPENGRMFNAWANVEIKARKFDEAYRILQSGINLYPIDTSLLNSAGKMEERRGNYTGAKDLYQKSLSIEPSAPSLVALATLELRRSQVDASVFEQVQEYFERALLLDPRHGPAYNAYGKMLQIRRNYTAARQVYRRGVNADCTDAASVFHGLAKLEISQGNVDIARKVLLRGLDKVEDYARFMDTSRHERAVFLVHTLGMLELNSNRAVEAAKVFKTGLEKYERCSQLILGAALCEVKLGSIDKARQLFQQAVRADKRHAQAWQAWGVLESRAGNYTTAKTLFEAGIKSRPRHGALWHAYGVMEGRLGNIENARMLFHKGVQLSPKHVPLYQGWANIELRDDNLQKAKSLIGEALTLDKKEGSSWLVAAQIEKKIGNDGLVGLILRRGIECSPTEASLYRELGEHLVGKGRIGEAREILEKGLEVNPLHAPLYHSLAELEARVFNIEGLAKLNKRASEIFNTNALVPASSSGQAWESNLRMRRQQQQVPGGVTALAEKVGYTHEEDQQHFSDATDLEEEEVVKDLFQDE